MKIRIETDVTPFDLKMFLTRNDLKLPVFWDLDDRLVVTCNSRSRLAALELISWLLEPSHEEKAK